MAREMFDHVFKWAGVLIVAVALSGCAQKARMNAMIFDVTDATVINDTSPLYQQVDVEKVQGGEKTNPIWTSEVDNPEFAAALESTLRVHALLVEPSGSGRYRLTASLIGMDQPLLGVSFTVTATVRYVLVDATNGASVFDETIVKPYTAEFSDAFLGAERLRLANEGAIRENIGEFVRRLVDKLNVSSLPRGAISIAQAGAEVSAKP
jgi:hypothetical protein